jgi:hypothetical protein
MGWRHHIHDLWRHPGYSHTEQGMCIPFTLAEWIRYMQPLHWSM